MRFVLICTFHSLNRSICSINISFKPGSGCRSFGPTYPLIHLEEKSDVRPRLSGNVRRLNIQFPTSIMADIKDLKSG